MKAVGLRIRIISFSRFTVKNYDALNQGWIKKIFKQKFEQFFVKSKIENGSFLMEWRIKGYVFYEFVEKFQFLMWNFYFLRIRFRNEEFLLSSATFSLIVDESCFAESPIFFSRVPSWALESSWMCGPEFFRRSFWRSSSAFLKKVNFLKKKLNYG